MDKEAAEGIIKSAFTTTGQRCTAPSRVIVERSVKEELLKKVIALTKEMKVGNGLEQGVVIGPLVNEQQCRLVEDYVQKAVEEGGNIALGGRALSRRVRNMLLYAYYH